MTTIDDLFHEAGAGIERLGLAAIPFTESASTPTNADQLDRVFTGRRQELKTVFTQFQGRDRRRILVSGRIGIGKSAFVLQVLTALERNIPKLLPAYATLSAEANLTTTAFIALAYQLPKNRWAQSQLHQLGLPTAQPQKERTSKIGISKLLTAEMSEKDREPVRMERPTEALQQLIEQARDTYPGGIVIAIDDLDKQDPARIRHLMHDAQGTLKGTASFILTGHPIGMMGDLLTSERGFFDCKIALDDLDQPTTQQMLANYLASVRLNGDHPANQPPLPQDFLPFTPDAAREFCRASQGKPRLFNRLGNTVLTTAIAHNAPKIDLAMLREGLQASELSRREQASLNLKEQRLKQLLDERGTLSEETILLDDLESLGLRSFSDALPLLEKLEDADLANRNELGYDTEFEPINVDLPFSEPPNL